MIENGPTTPEEPEAQYSGAQYGDPRDPAPIGELIHGTLDALGDMQVRAELEAAQAEHRALVDPEIRGDRQVSDEELQAATERLSRARRAAGHILPPEQ